MKNPVTLCYKQINDLSLYMDLYTPDSDHPAPVVMWIHGGAWLEGDRSSPMLAWIVNHGFALASIDYRLSKDGPFPNHIIDCKDALVYLKDIARQYHCDPKRIAVAGDSAGGHLAALMGTSIGHADWEVPGADCSVKAVIDFYGPTDSTRDWPNARLPDSPESQLLGANVTSKAGRAKAAIASPLTYIDGSEPPFLIFHGDADDIVPFSQSLYLRDALEEAGVPVSMQRIWDGGHGFAMEPLKPTILHFLIRTLC